MKTNSLYIYRGIKFACVVVILLYAVSVSSQNEKRRDRTDSLSSILQEIKTTGSFERTGRYEPAAEGRSTFG